MADRKYDRDELVPQICERLARGEPLAVICRDIGISRRTVNLWRKEDAEIAQCFDEARDDGFDLLAAECLEIADSTQEGTEIVERAGKKEVHTGDMLGHRKLRIETRLKLLSKWDPRRYGDKLITENTNHTTVEVVDSDEMDRRLDRAIAAACEAAGVSAPNG